MFCSNHCVAQSPASAAPAAKPAVADGVVILDVNVKDAAGKSVSGLKETDFTLTDNGKRISPFAFMTLEGDKAPVEAILVFDSLPLDFQQIAYAKDEVSRFLRMNGGKLVHPVALAWLHKESSSVMKGGAAVQRPVSGGAGYLTCIPYTRDGNALAAEFDKAFIGEAPMLRAQGGDGAAERTQITLDAISLVTDIQSTVPGRKLLLWVGQELIATAGNNGPARELLFRSTVYLQNQLRKARMTMSLIDAVGLSARVTGVQAPHGGVSTQPRTAGPGTTDDARGYGQDRGDDAPRSASEAAAITLQALAKRSGGYVLFGGKAVAQHLADVMADADSSYALGYRPAAGTVPNEYHSTVVTVDVPGDKVFTSKGYYWDVQTSKH